MLQVLFLLGATSKLRSDSFGGFCCGHPNLSLSFSLYLSLSLSLSLSLRIYIYIYMYMKLHYSYGRPEKQGDRAGRGIDSALEIGVGSRIDEEFLGR